MKNLIFITIALLSCDLFAKESFGTKINLIKPQSISEVLNESTNSAVLVKAKVVKVCKTKGCWMALSDGKSELRVTFKDYGFFVPSTLIGKQVLAQAKLIKKEMSLEETKHMVKDEGGDPSKVNKARTEYRLVASGIEVL